MYVLCFGYDSYYGYSIGPVSFGREPLAASYDVKWLSDVQGGGSNFPYILLNEIQTMFSQLAKQSMRF